jgi:hypothetical protein
VFTVNEMAASLLLMQASCHVSLLTTAADRWHVDSEQIEISCPVLSGILSGSSGSNMPWNQSR